MNNSEYLLKTFWEAADQDATFAQYLYKQVTERIESGRSLDCDEFRALMSLAEKNNGAEISVAGQRRYLGAAEGEPIAKTAESAAKPHHCEWQHDCHAPFCDCGLTGRTWADEERDSRTKEQRDL